MINGGNHKIMSVIYSFSGAEGLDKLSKVHLEPLKSYCDVKKSKTYIVD